MVAHVERLPPSIRLPGHTPHAGMILEWRLSPHDEWWAYVQWTAELGGYKGGIELRKTWFHEGRVQPIEGEDYGRVPPTYAQPARP
jgi:hypothetical protein